MGDYFGMKYLGLFYLFVKKIFLSPEEMVVELNLHIWQLN
jgi:hypothetical protein